MVGEGFRDKILVKVGDNICEIMESSVTELICIAPASVIPSTVSISFLFENTTIHTISNFVYSDSGMPVVTALNTTQIYGIGKS